MSDERRIQLWPSGKLVVARGDFSGPDAAVCLPDVGAWRPPTDEERAAVRAEEIAARLIDREVYCCDSAMVTDAMGLGEDSEFGRQFGMDNVSGLRPDPSDWSARECREWLQDEGAEAGAVDADADPWQMPRAAILDELDMTDAHKPVEEYTDEELREILFTQIDEETRDGVEEWRQAVRDHATDAEVYEWWRVSEWLADRLSEAGQPLLYNNYGYWWGRTCTGQGMQMDGTFQRIARTML